MSSGPHGPIFVLNYLIFIFSLNRNCICKSKNYYIYSNAVNYCAAHLWQLIATSLLNQWKMLVQEFPININY